MNIYLSAALASAQDLNAACARYDALASGLAARGIVVYVPHHFTHPMRNVQTSPADVYQRDSARLLGSSALVALLDDPSFGVGAEIALAIAHNMPVVGAVTRSRAKHLSRYITGLIETGRFPDLVLYDDIDALVIAVGDLLSSHLPIAGGEPFLQAERRAPHRSDA